MRLSELDCRRSQDPAQRYDHLFNWLNKKCLLKKAQQTGMSGISIMKWMSSSFDCVDLHLTHQHLFVDLYVPFLLENHPSLLLLRHLVCHGDDNHCRDMCAHHHKLHRDSLNLDTRHHRYSQPLLLVDWPWATEKRLQKGIKLTCSFLYSLTTMINYSMNGRSGVECSGRIKNNYLHSIERLFFGL